MLQRGAADGQPHTCSCPGVHKRHIMGRRCPCKQGLCEATRSASNLPRSHREAGGRVDVREALIRSARKILATTLCGQEACHRRSQRVPPWQATRQIWVGRLNQRLGRQICSMLRCGFSTGGRRLRHLCRNLLFGLTSVRLGTSWPCPIQARRGCSILHIIARWQGTSDATRGARKTNDHMRQLGKHMGMFAIARKQAPTDP